MKFTNKLNLPKALVRAVTNDPYDKGGADFSITELLKPPRQRALQIRHEHEIEEDVSDRLWSLYGQIAHGILERANGEDLAEQRFFMPIGGLVVSGQIDSLSWENDILSDWKFTTSWGFIAGKLPKPEWVQQLNMQRFLVMANVDRNIERLQIVGLLRDWQIAEAEKNNKYPQSPIAIASIPLWDVRKTEAFILDRIAAHSKAQYEDLPYCSDEERWARHGGYAVMKPGGKRAVKIVSTAEEAKEIVSQYEDGYIEIRKSRSVRCLNYCSAAPFCTQYREEEYGKD